MTLPQGFWLPNQERNDVPVFIGQQWVARSPSEYKPLLGLVVDDLAGGAWTPVPFNAGDYTSDVGSWTVAGGNVDTFKYRLIGHTMFVTFVINATSIAGTPNYLSIKIPAGKTATTTAYAACPIMLDNALRVSGYCEVLRNQTTINLHRQDVVAFTNAASTTYVYATLFFEIN